jgi:hypothetical protein
MTEDTPHRAMIVIGITAGTLMGLTVGALTGLALASLLERSPRYGRDGDCNRTP